MILDPTMVVQPARPGVTPARLQTHSSNLAQAQPTLTPTMTARLLGLRRELYSAVSVPVAVLQEEKAVRQVVMQSQLAILLASFALVAANGAWKRSWTRYSREQRRKCQQCRHLYFRAGTRGLLIAMPLFVVSRL